MAMITRPYVVARIEAMERELAQLKREVTPRSKQRKSPRGALKGLVVEIAEIKQAAREIFERPL